MLMACTPDGRRRPGLAQAADLMSTVLFGLAAFDLANQMGLGGPGIVSGVTVFSLIVATLNWLVSLAAVCLLWLPACSAFFRSQGFVQARHQAQMAELARLRSSRARWPRQV